jgi:hypothetical protein
VHSVYEFTTSDFPDHLVRVKVVEAPEGQFQAVADQMVISDKYPDGSPLSQTNQVSPELALQSGIAEFLRQLGGAGSKRRLVPIHCW